MRHLLRVVVLVFVALALLISIMPAAAQEACTVSVARANSARLRQGPGTDQAIAGFLPANTPFQPIERFNGTRRQVWYRLVPEQVLPGVAVAEVWVGSTAVQVTGNCDAVPLRNPPAAAAPSGGSTTAPGTLLPQAGRWQVNIDGNSLISCVGTETLTISTAELYGTTDLSVTTRIRETGGLFTIDGVAVTPWENNQFNGLLLVEGQTSAQMIVRVDSRTQMSGVLIFTGTVDGITCSSTTNVVAVRTGR